MKYFLILNPGSKGGKSKKRLDKILEILNQEGIPYEYKITSSLGDAYDYSLEANEKKYDVIVAVGGDGTINNVINGFYDSEGKRISNAKFAVIYTGTSPDFCKSYEIPISVKKAIKVLLKGKSKKIKIGKVTYSSIQDKELENKSVEFLGKNKKTSFFACCVNIGLGAYIAKCANSGIRKYIGDIPGTFVALIQTLLKYKPCEFIVNKDGNKQIIKNVFNLSIGKTTYIASGIKVKNNLSRKDNRFYYLSVRNMNFFNCFYVFKRIYSKKEFLNDSILSLEYGEKLEIYGNNTNSQIEFDGDPRGFLPCFIEEAKDPLDLIYGG